jgi:putative inorganic carbon (HCO3(-)) transporter
MREGYDVPETQMVQKATRRQQPRFLVWLSIGFYWLIRLEWLAVVMAAPFLLFPTVYPTLTAAILIALVVLWLLCWIVRREPWPVIPFNGALLLFALMIPVAIWASAFPELTLPKATGLVLGLAVFRIAALVVRDRRSLNPALVAFCVLGLGIIAVGAVGARWPTKVDFLGVWTQYIPQLISSLPDLQAAGISTNQLAGTLTLYLPLLAMLSGFRIPSESVFRRLLVPIGTAGFLLLTAAVLLLTQSRAGWVGGAVGLLALGTLWGLSHRQRWARAFGIVLPLLALLVVAGVFLYVGPRRVMETIYEAGSGTAVEEAIGEMSLAGRIEIWNRALYAIQDFPFTGCGLGTFRRVVHILYPLFLISPDTDIAHAHNIFLQTALDLGLPGLIAYLALLGIAMATCWRCARHGGPLVRATALGLAAGLVGLHVYGLADAVALGSKPGVAFWFALGLIAALPRVAEQERIESKDRSEDSYALRFTRYTRVHPWLTVIIALFVVAILVTGAYLVWRAFPEAPSTQPAIRLPLYPEAQGVDVHTEAPPAGAGWVGSLEIATFTTTHPIADVASFYTTTLAEVGWQTEVEAGDETSWGGIYTQEGGLSVCLLNAFDIEGETWVSIVCGDKAEPVDIPPLPSNE